MISFQDWQKAELKIAKIVSVEDVPGKDRLLKLEISLGAEKRTIVAGIRQFYPKEKLVGKQIVIVANLEPRQVAGLASNGMLLAVMDKNKQYSLLTVETEVEPGTRIE